jgi:hypothetical protein
MKYIFFSILLPFLFGQLNAQLLQPGFQKAEFIELLKMNGCQSDTIRPKASFKPPNFERVYRSPIVGMKNRWDLWINHAHNIAGISIRGTAGADLTSWMENFYIGMVPAEGTIQLNSGKVVDYKFSTDPKAAVHAGWTIGLAAMKDDILSKLDSCSNAGIKSFYIVGHSQGGAIAYLLTAMLRIMQNEGKLSKELQFKTYSMASPKPGNLFFAYNYETLTQNAWAFNVVNSEDWVPEMPLSVQTTNDFSTTNPFVDIVPKVRKLKFPFDMVILSMYREMNNALENARKKLEKNLGDKVGKFIARSQSNLKIPNFYPSQSYVRTGATIVLYADDKYYQKFPKDSKEKIFTHHMMNAYLFLGEELPNP